MQHAALWRIFPGNDTKDHAVLISMSCRSKDVKRMLCSEVKKDNAGLNNTIKLITKHSFSFPVFAKVSADYVITRWD